MLSTISRQRWLNRLSFRGVLEGNVRQKIFKNQAIAFSSHDLIGYAETNSVRFCHNNHYERCNRARRLFSSQKDPTDSSQKELDPVQFDKISEETLESLTEYFDELMEQAEHLKEADISYGDGVLTIKFGDDYGTYVINRQTPNKQIWLSSPKSGPKRYDFTAGGWIYKHDGKSLHELLDNEIPAVVKRNTAFCDCSYGGGEISRKKSQ